VNEGEVIDTTRKIKIQIEGKSTQKMRKAQEKEVMIAERMTEEKEGRIETDIRAKVNYMNSVRKMKE